MFANGKALSENRRFRHVLGRVAVVTTVWEGFCDIGSMLYCGCSAGGGWRRMEMKDKLREREALSPTGFYDQYYADSGLDQETVVELLEHVADELRLPSGKLRPGDRFSKELSPGEADGWDSGYGVLIFELQSLAKERGIAVNRRVDSLDDYIRIMAGIY